ncbi:MAG TPA: formate dehydrogenase subunit delta [Steroidobacteraceae bacterium]|nr:formate dehydrogenase subunit delta [Steroidobacteraceae bacterium]
MNVDHLVKMANEIGSFFAGASPSEQAPRDVATHLRRYWEPRMRKAMLAHFAKGGAGLSDVARRAVTILAAEAAAAGATGAAGAAGAAPRAGQGGPSPGATPPPGKA